MRLKTSLGTIYLVLLFYVSPFIDAMSGFLILSGKLSEGGAGSPSQIFRLLLMVISLIILTNSKKYFITIVLFLSYSILLEFSMLQVHLSPFGYIVGLIYATKIIYLMLVFLTLSHLFKIGELDYNKLLKYIVNYTTLMAILLIIPFMLGIGFPTYYEGTFGTKGFFSAGNGLGIFMGVGLLLSVYYWQQTRQRFSLIKTFVILFATVIIGTKTAFILSVLGLSSIIFYLKNKYLSYGLIIIFVIFGLMFYSFLVDSLTLIFDVVVNRLNNNESFMSFLMSARDTYFVDAINHVSYDGLLILRLLFGMGVFLSFRNPDDSMNGIDTLESDFADLFFMYGILGLFLYLTLIFIGLKKFFVRKHFFLTFIFLMLSIHSLVAGHVLFNGMSGILLPLLLLLSFEKNKKLKA